MQKREFRSSSFVLIAAISLALGLVLIAILAVFGLSRSTPDIILPLGKPEEVDFSFSQEEPKVMPVIFAPNERSALLILRSIPASSNYSISGALNLRGSQSRLDIKSYRGAVLFSEQKNGKISKTMIIGNRVFHWTAGEKTYQVSESDDPYDDFGYGFFDPSFSDDDLFLEAESCLYGVSTGLDFVVKRAGDAYPTRYSLSTETGAMFSFDYPSTSNSVASFRLYSLDAEGAAEKDFRLPDGSMPDFLY